MDKDNVPYLERTNNGTSFALQYVDIFSIIVLAKGLELYANHEIKPTAYYTPKNMLLMATKFTQKPYKRGKKGYLAAAADLMTLSDELKNNPRQTQGIWERNGE